MNPSGPSKPAALGAVVITVIWTGIFYANVLDRVQQHHRVVHNLPPVEWSFLWFKGSDDAAVPFSTLDAAEYVALFGTTVLFLFIHPVIGRIVSVVIKRLCQKWDDLFFDDETIGTWPPAIALIVGSMWLITIFAIPFLILGIVIGGVYRVLWT